MLEKLLMVLYKFLKNSYKLEITTKDVTLYVCGILCGMPLLLEPDFRR